MEGVHRILVGLSRIFHGVCRILEGLHIDLHPTHHDTPFAGLREDEDGTSTVATIYSVVAEEDCKAVRKGRQAGWARWGGRHVGVAGRVGTLAWSDGRQGGWWEENCIFM